MAARVLDIRYIAGITDGEGCITIVKRSIAGVNGARFIPVVVISMTDKAAVRQIHRRFGGTLYLKKANKPGHKPAWQWRITGHNLLNFLKAVSPYLLVKGTQAKLAMKLAKIQAANRQGAVKGEWGRRALSRELVVQRAAICKEIQRLNKRGV